MISASVLAAQGHLLTWLIVPLVALAGIAGDNASYLVGKHFGCRIAGKVTRGGRR